MSYIVRVPSIDRSVTVEDAFTPKQAVEQAVDRLLLAYPFELPVLVEVTISSGGKMWFQANPRPAVEATRVGAPREVTP